MISAIGTEMTMSWLWRLKDMAHATGLILVVAIVTLSDANACRGPDFHGTIFFDSVPSTNTSPIAARVTIIEVASKPAEAARDPANPDRFYQRGLARVDRVIRGRLDTATITILAPDTACDLRLTVGTSGIVVGEIRSDTQGALRLVVEAESRAERELRMKSN